MSPTASDDLRDLLALHLAPGLGPCRIAALLQHFGSAARARRAGAAELRAVDGIGPKLAEQLARALPAADVEGELRQAERAGVRLVALGTPEYPAALANIPDPPQVLYVRGTLTAADALAVALVGSRGCSEYGRRTTARLAAGLARAGVCVVSGLARGVDGVAHRATLEAGGRTLAVLANGLSRIYPPEHADLARQVDAAGAVVTESCMGQAPLAPLFPARNRIISGLCRAVVIVEAADRSGALITASHAAEQGRTVLAVPGPVDAPASGGANELLRKGAVPCRSVEDILEELHGVSAVAQMQKAAPTPVPAAPAGPPPGLDETQRRLWEALADGPQHLDDLVRRLALPVPQATTALLMLEMRKAARRLPGNRYERC